MALTIRQDFYGHAEYAIPEMEERSTESEPRGFRYQDEIITEAEQAALVESLQQLDLKPFEFHGYLGIDGWSALG